MPSFGGGGGGGGSPVNPLLSWFLTFGANALTLTTPAVYLLPGYEAATAGAAAVEVMTVGPCTLRSLQMRTQVAGVGAGQLVYELRRNGLIVATMQVPVTALVGSLVFPSPIACVAGDRLAISVSKTAAITTSPARITVSLEVGP